LELIHLIEDDLRQNSLSAEISTKIFNLTCLISEANQKINICGTKDADEIYLRHMREYFLLLPELSRSPEGSFLDLGCGAGFFGLLTLICAPSMSVSFLDSTVKKLNVIEQISRELELTDYTILSGRGEDLAHLKRYREQFDFVCTRAVAPLNIVPELAGSFVKINGMWFNYYRPCNERSSSMKLIADELGFEIRSPLSYTRQTENLEIMRWQKATLTPKLYPRTWQQMLHHPIGES